jgi:hypothetical protein
MTRKTDKVSDIRKDLGRRFARAAERKAIPVSALRQIVEAAEMWGDDKED